MPTKEWLQSQFDYGYDSGDVLAIFPDEIRAGEEAQIGGSFRRTFCEFCLPFITEDSRVLELGPGKGSWSRAILQYIPRGQLHTVDYQDVTKWLHPSQYGGRLICHQVTDNSFSAVQDNYFDFFWSIGVLCHHNQEDLAEVLGNSRSKLRPGALSVHQYSEWNKLEKYGWDRGGVPTEFQAKPDNEIWWPRNTTEQMAQTATEAGWNVLVPDLNIFKRDGLILLQNPE